MLAPTSCRRQEVALPGRDTFAVVIGGAAGALIGLLFVSVSIRIDVISASPDFRNRSAATLSLFVTVLLVAILLVVPGQEAWQLGAELLVLASARGGMLLAGVDDGVYLVIPAVIAAITGGVASVWLFLIRIAP
jgi:hypothetical protein